MSSSASLSASLSDANLTVAVFPKRAAADSRTPIEEHLRVLREIHEKEKDLSIDELARAVFSEFDRSNSGHISFHDLAAILLERTSADHDHATSDLEIELLVESRADVQNMLRILDPKGTGKIDYPDFYRAFTFFEFFRLGYKKGFQVALKCANEQDETSIYDSSDIEFDEFCHILLHDRALQKRFAAFQTTWSTVYRPGLLKTPIHKKRKLSSLEDFIAGSFAGIVTTLVGHPFDTVKVRMQTAYLLAGSDSIGVGASASSSVSSLSPKPPSASTSWMEKSPMMAAIRRGKLYAGLSSPMYSIPLVNAIVFASYEQCKSLLLRSRPADSQLSEGELAVCGGVAGLVSCSVVSPVELVRSKMQVDSRGQFRNSLDCAMKTLRSEGIRGLGRGMMATVFRDVPAYVAQFYVYEGLKRLLKPEGVSIDQLPTKYILLAGGLGGSAGWLVSYPMDNVKTNLQVAPPGTFKKHSFIPDGGFIDCWRKTVAERGVRGLFNGLAPCLARAFPVNACAYAAYEFSSKFLAENPMFGTTSSLEK